MTSRDFCYWLQGFFEIHGSAPALTPEQSDMIRRHLAMVFVHEIDKTHGTPEEQAKLDQIHQAKSGVVFRC